MAIAHVQAIFACLTCGDIEPKVIIYPEEKAALLSTHDARPAADIAEDVVATLLHTSLVGPALRMQLESIVGAYGWRENVARWVLEKLMRALDCADDAREKLGPVINNAYHSAWEVANSIEGFVIEHPIMCSIIALGVLAIIAPWVLEALGFAESGPVGGTYHQGCVRGNC
jgi:hypothetical protein